MYIVGMTLPKIYAYFPPDSIGAEIGVKRGGNARRMFSRPAIPTQNGRAGLSSRSPIRTGSPQRVEGARGDPRDLGTPALS